MAPKIKMVCVWEGKGGKAVGSSGGEGTKEVSTGNAEGGRPFQNIVCWWNCRGHLLCPSAGLASWQSWRQWRWRWGLHWCSSYEDPRSIPHPAALSCVDICAMLFPRATEETNPNVLNIHEVGFTNDQALCILPLGYRHMNWSQQGLRRGTRCSKWEAGGKGSRIGMELPCYSPVLPRFGSSHCTWLQSCLLRVLNSLYLSKLNLVLKCKVCSLHMP